MTRVTLAFSLLPLISPCYAATVSSVVLTASSTSIQKGQTATLSCTVVYTTGARQACTAPAYSENQNGTVVKISGSSLFGYSVGSALVTATVAGTSGALSITVKPPTREDLGIIPATQVINGLGFNVTPGNDWEFSMAAAAHATHVRFQCGWSTLEMQTPPPQNSPATPRYALQSYCQSAYASARRYGLSPTVLAAYGAPFHPILSLTIPSGAVAGATSIDVQLASGQGGDTLASLAPFYDSLIGSDGTQLTNTHSYPGALITAIHVTDSTHATLTLASALASALPASASTLYIVNEDLYPPAATTAPNDPSVTMFAEYAQFLAQSIPNAGLSGQVELWNEPTWPDDRWDVRGNAYDVFPGPSVPGPTSAFLPNWGFVAALQNTPAPAGVTYIWGGTEKSGANSVLNPEMQLNTGVTFAQPAVSVTSESFHPYGNNPEDGIWMAPCFASTTGNNDFFSCNLFGLAGGNFSLAAQQDFFQKKDNPAYGVAHNLTETGFGLAYGDAAHQARFIMRQFLGYQAAGVTPIDFYRLYDTSSDQTGFVNTATLQPLPAYTAIAGLISEAATIGNATVAAVTSSTLPSIVSYTGTYPLDSVHIVGARPGDTLNSDLLALWQRSYVAAGAKWATLAQPPSGSVTLSIPKGWKLSQLTNLDTLQSVPYTTTSEGISFAISDDPIGVLVEPGK